MDMLSSVVTFALSGPYQDLPQTLKSLFFSQFTIDTIFMEDVTCFAKTFDVVTSDLYLAYFVLQRFMCSLLYMT